MELEMPKGPVKHYINVHIDTIFKFTIQKNITVIET